jgi:transposase
MSPQQRETPPSRRRFTAEFKADAVRLVTEHGYTHKAAADAIGLSDNTLSGWVRAMRLDPPPCADDANVDELQAEVKRLRKRLAQAEMEREILKKATTFFAKEST